MRSLTEAFLLFSLLVVRLEEAVGLALHKQARAKSLQEQQGGSSFHSATDTLEHKRRSFLAAVASSASIFLLLPKPSRATVTDETDTFADNWWSSKQKAPTTKVTGSVPVTDEVIVTLSKQKLREGFGLELKDIEFRTNIRVYVKSVAPGSYAERQGVQKDWLVVDVNGQSTERTNAAGVKEYLLRAMIDDINYVQITFRDPSIFQSQLQDLSAQQGPVTTQVAPAGETTQRNPDGGVRAGKAVTVTAEDQRVTVEQLVAPSICHRGATIDDLLELSYTGTVVQTGQIFDGSSVLIDGQGIPGRGNDITTYFVLGKQPFGQFPPGWDVGLTGMCVGERRRLILPPALGYGRQGVPRRKIPPDATLQYDVTLVSLNGLSTPQ